MTNELTLNPSTSITVPPQKTLLSIDDAITLGQLEHGLKRVGEHYAKWELCSQYAILGQISMLVLCAVTGVPLGSIVVPALLGILAWAGLAAWFHIRRDHLWMPEAWLVTALTVKAFALPTDLLDKSRPGGSVQWFVARRWLERWRHSVVLPTEEEMRAKSRVQRATQVSANSSIDQRTPRRPL